MALLSMAVHAEGFEAVSLTGSQCGIITTDSHSNARIMDVRPFRVQDELDKGKVVIVAGYQGTSYRREVTTLGRGGSDTTAVALAAALQAEACEIYSDVDGIYSGDPRVILSARQLVSLTHDEMLEMARSGARVLNEEAVAFAKRAQIALFARSTHLPDSQGTIIRPDGFEDRARRAEEGMPRAAVAHMEEGLFVRAGESADLVMETLEHYECIACEWEPRRQVELFLGLENVHNLDDLQSELRALGDDVTCMSRGLVSAVGDGIGGKPRWVSHGLRALEGGDIAPEAIFVSLARVSFVLPQDDVSEAANLLHDAFLD
jgi:aspartate kinase